MLHSAGNGAAMRVVPLVLIVLGAAKTKHLSEVNPFSIVCGVN
jgi:ADP-ribosylglycohydrolase